MSKFDACWRPALACFTQHGNKHMPDVKLTALEIEAILSAAGAADAPAVFEDEPSVEHGEAMLHAFETGMEKLRVMLAAKQASKAKRRSSR